MALNIKGSKEQKGNAAPVVTVITHPSDNVTGPEPCELKHFRPFIFRTPTFAAIFLVTIGILVSLEIAIRTMLDLTGPIPARFAAASQKSIYVRDADQGSSMNDLTTVYGTIRTTTHCRNGDQTVVKQIRLTTVEVVTKINSFKSTESSYNRPGADMTLSALSLTVSLSKSIETTKVSGTEIATATDRNRPVSCHSGDRTVTRTVHLTQTSTVYIPHTVTSTRGRGAILWPRSFALGSNSSMDAAPTGDGTKTAMLTRTNRPVTTQAQSHDRHQTVTSAVSSEATSDDLILRMRVPRKDGSQPDRADPADYMTLWRPRPPPPPRRYVARSLAVDSSSSIDATITMQQSPTVIAHTTAFLTALPTLTTSSTSLPSPAGTLPEVVDLQQWSFTGGDYFVGSYLPIFVAVGYKIFWTMFLAALNLLQPFFELSKQRGTRTGEALGLYYLSSSFTPQALQALFKGHYLLLWTSTTVLAAGLIIPLSSEAFSVDTQRCTAAFDPDNPHSSYNPCPPRIVVDKTVIRVIEGLLIFVGIMTMNLWYLVRGAKSGVHADPSSIATMASLLHHPDVLADFQHVLPNATNNEMMQQLSGKAYKLGNYLSENGEPRYGLVKVSGVDEYPSRTAPALTADKALCTSKNARRYQSKIPKLTTLGDIILGGLLLGVLGTIVSYYMVTGDNGFNNFMNSGSFGPRFILTLTGSLIDARWKQVEREIRVLAPYRRLAASPATAADSILIDGTVHPITTIPSALYHQRWMLALVACVSALAEVLVIALAGVPLQSGQLYLAFRVSIFTSMGILGLMLITLCCVAIWRRTNPQLPRSPDTLASVWSYLCASRMTESFADLSTLDEKERNRRIISMRNNYTLGFAAGVDGAPRLTIDEVEKSES